MFDIDRVRASWQREVAAIDAIITTINDETAAQPVRSDGWTTHDLLGHIANAARAFVLYVQGSLAEQVDIDSYNARALERGRQRSWPDVQAYWERVKGEVGAFLESATNEIGEQPTSVPHLPQIKTAGEALRIMIIHTHSHREEIEAGFPPVQA